MIPLGDPLISKVEKLKLLKQMVLFFLTFFCPESCSFFWASLFAYLLFDCLGLGFVTGICRDGRLNFGDQRTDVHKELCTLPVD